MCGRFVSGTGKVSWRQFSQLLQFPDPSVPPDGGDIFPTQPAPIIRNDEDSDDANELVSLQFGLVPSWAADPKEVRNLFNVRGETARQKFGKLFKHRRCVIPTTGFYHWGPKEDDGTKRGHKPMYKIGAGDDESCTLLAGLWSSYRTGPPFTFAILTTEPGSKAMRDIHHRMPVILDVDQAKQWLDREADPAKLEAFTAPWASPLWVEKIEKAEKNEIAKG